MEIVNKPEVSRFVAWLYAGMTIFIAVLIAFFTYAGLYTPMGTIGIVAVAILVVIETVILSILASICRTRYILKDEELVIKASRLIGGSKRIPLKTIKSLKRTLIPYDFRIFGASLYGGHYYLPGLGRAFMTITNFNDGLLIKAERGNYVITPKNPESFKENVNRMLKASQPSSPKSER